MRNHHVWVVWVWNGINVSGIFLFMACALRDGDGNSLMKKRSIFVCSIAVSSFLTQCVTNHRYTAQLQPSTHPPFLGGINSVPPDNGMAMFDNEATTMDERRLQENSFSFAVTNYHTW